MVDVVTWLNPGDGEVRVVLCGSPRANGRSAALAAKLADELVQEHPGDSVALVSLASAKIHGCVGCDTCREAGECVFDDDMVMLLTLLERACELHVVSPVYFAGPPSQLKALLDRLQPHYWRQTRKQEKRPAYLTVVGEGGDPHGFGPLVAICRSALAVAGFELQDLRAYIGSDAPQTGALDG